MSIVQKLIESTNVEVSTSVLPFANTLLPAGRCFNVLSLFDGMSCGQQALE